MNLKKYVALTRSFLMLAFFTSSTALAGNTYSLQQVLEIAFNEHPSVRVAKAQEAAAIANVTTAKSFANPEVESLKLSYINHIV